MKVMEKQIEIRDQRLKNEDQKKKKNPTQNTNKQWRQPQMVFYKENRIVEIKSNYEEVTPSP